MQNREWIVFERTSDTEQRIHEPFVSHVLIPSSTNRPHRRHARIAVAFSRWNFLLPAAKKK